GGEVRAIAAGQTTISASSEGKSAETKITVKAPPAPVNPPVAVTPPPVATEPARPEPEPPAAVANVLLNSGPKTLTVAAVVTWLASARDGKGKELTGRPITWSSSEPQVASVSSTGVITALSAGSTEIKVEAEGKSAKTLLTVKAAPVAVTPPAAV